jgi:hypothetical protein
LDLLHDRNPEVQKVCDATLQIIGEYSAGLYKHRDEKDCGRKEDVAILNVSVDRDGEQNLTIAKRYVYVLEENVKYCTAVSHDLR